MKKMLLYTLSLILLSSNALYAGTIQVAVASSNNHKIAAVKDAFNQHFAHDTIVVKGYTVDSHISAQPIGKQNAFTGASNRISGIPSKELATADYVIAIENYIEPAPFSSNWQDVGLVVILDNNKRNSSEITTTQPTFIPLCLVQKAQQQAHHTNSGMSVTIGSLIKQEFSQSHGHIDERNWHSLPEFGGTSRKQLLQDAISKGLAAQEIAFLKKQLAFHQDFPKKGICFVDIFPLLRNPQALQTCIKLLTQRYKNKNIDVIVGLEARGFLLGAALAAQIGAGFVPVRKPNKLPGDTHTVTYEKEYGTDSLTIAQNALQKNQRVLIVDDLIATGGSARAAIELVRKAGAIPVEFTSLVQIPELAEKTQLGVPLFNLID